jgi:cell wall-associated NlpC family hydrolase
VTTKLRLVLLVLALAYSLVFGPAQVLAARTKGHLAGSLLSERLFTSSHWFATAHRAARPSHTAQALTLGTRAVRFARHLVGVPYRWGGTSPRTGFDCSGFVRFVYNHFGVQLPHSSYADFSLGRGVSRRALRPGDLVFFNGLGHVGLYVGNGRFIHAPHSGTRVEIDVLSVGGQLDGARRLAPAAA